MNFKPPRPGLILSFGKVVTRLVVGLLLVNLLVVFLAASSLYQSRLKYEEEASVASQNLARLLDHDIASLLERIDFALLATAGEAERQLASGGLHEPALNGFIEQQFTHQPDLDGLRMTDAKGFITYGSGMAAGRAASLADRDDFIRLKNEPNAGLVVSKPLLGRTNGKWVIAVSRRLQHRDGSFAGIVFGTIPLEHFTKTYSSLYVGKNGTFTLFDNTLSIITRQPEPGGLGSSVGMKFGSPQLHEHFKAGHSEGTYRVLSTVDGMERVYSFRRIKDLPLNIVIGIASEDYLSGWWSEARKTLALVSIFLLVTLLFSWFIYRAWKRQESAVAALQDANLTLDAEKNLKQTIIQSSPLAILSLIHI